MLAEQPTEEHAPETAQPSVPTYERRSPRDRAMGEARGRHERHRTTEAGLGTSSPQQRWLTMALAFACGLLLVITIALLRDAPGVTPAPRPRASGEQTAGDRRAPRCRRPLLIATLACPPDELRRREGVETVVRGRRALLDHLSPRREVQRIQKRRRRRRVVCPPCPHPKPPSWKRPRRRRVRAVKRLETSAAESARAARVPCEDNRRPKEVHE